MKLSTVLSVLLAFGSTALAAMTSSEAPTIFAPGAIAGTADDGAAAFTPDGATVYFMRGTDSFTLMESHRDRGHWSTPKAASFSGHWRDLDPAMAPDGSFLLFVSNRPALPGGKPIDEAHAASLRGGASNASSSSMNARDGRATKTPGESSRSGSSPRQKR